MIPQILMIATFAQETPVEFLTHHLSLLGLDLQWWMPIIIGACAIYVMWLWLTGQLSR
jgi:hypothetical protein